MIYFDVHSHTQHSTPDTLVLRHQYPLTADTSEPFSVGIHPWYLHNWEEQWQALLPLAEYPNCWAIGECGLDKNASAPWSLQQEIFHKHIALSETLRLPLIIHCVKAYAEIISLRKQTRAQQLWVIHGFRKNLAVAQSLIAHGIALSFGEALLRDPKLLQLCRSLPPEYCFFETDDAQISVREVIEKYYFGTSSLAKL